MILTTEHIKQVITVFFEKKPVKKVWLFGSYARGEADDNSDVDVLVDIDHSKPVGWEYYVWRDELVALLKKKVDVVSVGWENAHIKPFIDKDKLVIYERVNF